MRAVERAWPGKPARRTRTRGGWRRTAFGKTAEFVGEYLTSGRQVSLDGPLQTRAYNDTHGVRRWATTIVVNRLQILDHRLADQQ